MQTELKEKEEEISKLNKKILDEYKKSNTILNLSKGVESENFELKHQLEESRAMLESLRKLYQEKNEVDQEKIKLKEELEKCQKFNVAAQKEIFSLAKKLKDIKPKWRPNTQNLKVFMREVLKELWNQLRTLMLEKEEAEISNNRNVVSNKDFINLQFSEKKTIRNKRNEIDEEKLNKKLEYSMNFLAEIINYVDEVNNSFDNSVIDDVGGLDSQRLFPDLILFFEKVEKVRSQYEFKKLMKEFFN